MRTALTALTLALCTAMPAAAQPVAVAYDPAPVEVLPPPRDPDPEHHVQPMGQLGMLLGSQRVGPLAGIAVGMQVDAGISYRRLAVLGEYDFASVGETDTYTTVDAVRGLMHRFGGNVRYRFARVGDKPLAGDFWLEAGAGREYIRWYGGGALARNDVSAGLGGQLTIRWGHDEHPKKLGVFYALKVIGAKRPEAKMGPPTCAGPCDTATGPMPYDLGIYFNFALTFGR